MNAYLANIRLTVSDGSTKVVQALVSARNPNDARLLLDAMYGFGKVISNPVKMPY